MRERFGWLLFLALVAWSSPVRAGDKAIEVGKGVSVKGDVKTDDKQTIEGKPLVAKQYLVNFENGKTYRISLLAGADGFDPLLVIADKDGKFLAADDDGGGKLDSLLTFKAPAAGTYKVMAGSLDGRAGPYTLKIDPVDSKDGKDLEGKELEVGKGLRITGTLNAGKKEYVYKVKMQEGKTYRIDQVSGAFDSFLEIKGPDGKILAEDDDGGEGLNSRLVFRAPASGVFHIVSTSLGRLGSGNFVLEVREE